LNRSKNECPICLEPIFDVEDTATFLCCGNKVWKGCSTSLTATADATCPLCRARFPSESEQLRIIQSKAEEGKAWAQYKLGFMFSKGLLGVIADDRKAELLVRKAVDQGYSNAQFYLGLLELSRDNHSEARRLFETAASQGHMSAVGQLGTLYLLRDGVERDDTKAVRLLTISAKLQKTDSSVHANLGHCFVPGAGGLEMSLVRAVHYMKSDIETNEMPSANVKFYAGSLLLLSKRYYPDLEIIPSGYNIAPEALFWYRRGDDDAVPFVEAYESAIKELCACCYEPLSTDNRKCCVECRAIYYCSKECQVADWKAGHKKDCVKSLKKRLRATGEFDDV